MKIVEAKEARERLTPEICIELMKEALMRLDKGEAMQPPRSVNSIPGKPRIRVSFPHGLCDDV